MKDKLKEYQELIISWAKDKNITGAECIPMQRLKLIEEVGEIASAIVKNKREEYIDGIGDSFVVLTILAEQNNEVFEIDLQRTGDYAALDLSELISSIIYHEIFVDFEVFLEVCDKLEVDILDCVSSAWNEIKDRKGKTSGGVFIKNED
ncbi:MAG TPA: MazG-like family protein [Nitrososphaeraceae archaeon]|nr:MazG-like family protein [Nitrososphaeraceae archaeon]